MSRTHRMIVSVAAVSWVISLGLMSSLWFVDLSHVGKAQALLRVASINVGALAACLTTVAVLPYMLKEFYQDQVSDYIGSYLAGWAGAQEVEPDEPVKLHAVV